MTKVQQQERRLQWEKRIDEYRASGQSVREWCAANGVKPGRLWYWLRRMKTEDAEAKPARWLSVEVGSPFTAERQAGAGLLVKVGKAGIEVKPGFDPELLTAVVRALSEVC